METPVSLPTRASEIGTPAAPRAGLAAVVAGALAVTVAWIALSPDFAITWDERARHAYGVNVLRFWRGEVGYDFFAPTPSGGHLYAALFDTSAAWLHERVGGDVWTVRHALNAAVGGLGLLGAGLVALRLFGTWTALVAMALLACSPRYVGHAMNNPKDLPFAAACALVLAASTLARPRWPFLPWRHAAVIGVALAVALNVRPGALLYLAFFWALLAILTVVDRAWAPRRVLRTIGMATLVSLLTLLLGTALWPWAQLNPLVRPFQALVQVSHFEWGGSMLFMGRDVLARHPPASYVPVWMAITIPPVVLAGLLFAAWRTAASPEARWRCLALWAVALVPIALVIVRGSTLYDDWRHLLFTYPPLVVLAAAGWTALVRAASARSWGLGALAVAVLVAGCLEPAAFMVRNHPHEVVYFNAFIGGPRGAFRRFDMDYWGSSLAEAMRWSATLARRAGVPLAVSGNPREIVAANARREPGLYALQPWEGRHHLQVELLRLSSANLAATMVRGDALHVVRMDDGTPLAAVYPGPRFADVAAKVHPHLAER